MSRPTRRRGAGRRTNHAGATGPRAALPRVTRPLAVIRRAAGRRPPAPKVIRIAPRSAVAAMLPTAPTPAGAPPDAPPDALFVLTVVGAEGPETQLRPRRLATLRRRLAALAAAALVVAAAAVAAGGTRVVLATFTDQAAVAGTFATGTWGAPTTWYLHDDPSPPTADTTATAVLPMDDATPTATTLVNYDTDCDDRPGRSMDRGTGLVTETAPCASATWRSAPLAAPRILDGVATLVAYARKQTTGGPNPTLRAYLRVLDPATGAYTEIATSGIAVNTNPQQAWSMRTFSWTLAGVELPAGAQVEVRVVASGGRPDLEIAYDTVGQPSALTLP